MAKTLDDVLAKRPLDRAAVDEHKRRMLDEARTYQLRELREALGFTQVQLAETLDVSQNRVSRLEHGDIERTQVDIPSLATSRPSAVSCTSKLKSASGESSLRS